MARVKNKILIPLLAVTMAFSLTACGGFTQDDIDNAVNSATLDLNAQIDQLTASIADKEAKIATLESEKAALTAEKTELEAEIETLEAEKATLESEKAALQADVNTLEDEKATLTAKSEQLDEDIKSLNDKIAELEASGEENTEEINQLKAELSTLEEEKTNINGRVTELENSISTKNAEIETLNSSISALESEKATLTDRVSELEASISAKDAEISDLNTSLATLQAEKQTLSDRVAELEDKNEALESEKSELEKENEILKDCVKGLHSFDYTPNNSSTHKVTCICGYVETDNHEFDPTNGKCICGAIQLTVVNAPNDDDHPFGDGWSNDEEEGLDSSASIGTQDFGKTAWEIDDQIIVTLTSETIGTQTCLLTYDGSNWTLDGSFVYAEGETPTVTAVYAPAGTLGMGEYITANCTFADGSITIDFNGVTRNYSRLRIVGLPNQTLTVTVIDFTPAGMNESCGDTTYILTTDEKGNAYLYGTFPERATVSVKKGEVTLSNCCFNADIYPGGTEQNVSYALEARPIIDGTLGGKTTTTEEDINALVEQLKEYVDNGITTIIVTGNNPAMYDSVMGTIPAYAEALYLLAEEPESEYCGTINLILPDATEIVDHAFDNAKALKSITLPEVKSVGDGAFYACTNLETIIFGSVVTAINQNKRVVFHMVGYKVGGCDLILNCGQMNSSYVPDLTANTWYDANNKYFKSITLTHTGECDECKAKQ